MKSFALVGPNTALGGPLKSFLSQAGMKGEEIEFFAPLENEDEKGFTEYDGAAEWVKSVMSEALTKARLILLCGPLPESVTPSPDAMVLDLPATLRGGGAPLLPAAGFTPGRHRLPSAAALAFAGLLKGPLPGPLHIWHLASATETLPDGALGLIEQAQKLLSGKSEADPADTSVFNLRRDGVVSDKTMQEELAWMGVKAPPLRCTRLDGGQFHCGVLLVDGLGDAPLAVNTPAPFVSAQSAAGLPAPLVHADAGGARLTIAYDPFTAALFPQLARLLEQFLAEA